ncbi:MAG: heme exporter protein CcmD [Geminicoccaceae bacterium]
MIDFLAMGGYAAYVWSAFAIAAALMVGLFLQSRRAAQQRDAELVELRSRIRPRAAVDVRPLRPRREAEAVSPAADSGR